ncbi:MAG: hypothetical protein V7K34_29620 [Nostoc sp.]
MPHDASCFKSAKPPNALPRQCPMPNAQCPMPHAPCPMPIYIKEF